MADKWKSNKTQGDGGAQRSASSGGSRPSGGGNSRPGNGYKPIGAGSSAMADYAGMSSQDRTALEQAGRDWTAAHAAGDKLGMEAAHAQAEQIRGQYGYSGGRDGSTYIPTNMGGGMGGMSGMGGMPNFSGMLNSWLAQAQQQQRQEADYAVQQGVAALEQAEREGQRRFQVQQNQVDRDELKALDNHALYAEARGDRGGIGQAQYDQIQASAMNNRQAVSEARTALAADTAHKIADLRAQGEFRKADALLKLSQEHLGKLTELYRWQSEMQMDRWEFTQQMDQWRQEYELKLGNMMGSLNGKPTLEAQKHEQTTLVKLGLAALEQGIRPSPAQQQAMGWTNQQIDAMVRHYQQTNQKPAVRPSRPARPSSHGGKEPTGGGRFQMPEELKKLDIFQQLYALGKRTEGDAYYFLIDAMGMADSKAKTLAKYFYQKVDNGDMLAWWENYKAKPKEKLLNLTGGTDQDTWVYVPGVGRVTTKELNQLLKRGYISRGYNQEKNQAFYYRTAK